MRRWLAAMAAVMLVVAGCGGKDRLSGGDPAAPPGSWWRPKVGASFHIQYGGKIDYDLPVDVYNLDWEQTSAEQVRALRARGVAPVCYLNAGAYEDWRGDKDRFPAEVLGEPLDGWPGERWLDVRQVDALMPIMAARMDVCKKKGFLAVDPDNTDGWVQKSGFSISKTDQVTYQRALADAAHSRDLGVGLKNNVEQLDEIKDFVDFAVNEECGAYHECDLYAGFLDSGKAVFRIEYKGSLAKICKDQPAGMSTVRAKLGLDASTKPCP